MFSRRFPRILLKAQTSVALYPLSLSYSSSSSPSTKSMISSIPKLCPESATIHPLLAPKWRILLLILESLSISSSPDSPAKSSPSIYKMWWCLTMPTSDPSRNGDLIPMATGWIPQISNFSENPINKNSTKWPKLHSKTSMDAGLSDLSLWRKFLVTFMLAVIHIKTSMSA